MYVYVSKCCNFFKERYWYFLSPSINGQLNWFHEIEELGPASMKFIHLIYVIKIYKKDHGSSLQNLSSCDKAWIRNTFVQKGENRLRAYCKTSEKGTNFVRWRVIINDCNGFFFGGGVGVCLFCWMVSSFVELVKLSSLSPSRMTRGKTARKNGRVKSWARDARFRVLLAPRSLHDHLFFCELFFCFTREGLRGTTRSLSYPMLQI